MNGGLPTHLPMQSLDLIDQLVALNPSPVVRGPVSEDDIQALVFAAGRHSIVEELKRLADAARSG